MIKALKWGKDHQKEIQNRMLHNARIEQKRNSKPLKRIQNKTKQNEDGKKDYRKLVHTDIRAANVIFIAFVYFFLECIVCSEHMCMTTITITGSFFSFFLFF